MLRWFAIFYFAFSSLAANAASDLCSHPFAPNALAFSLPEKTDQEYVANFKDFSKPLFLSEGANPFDAKNVARMKPHAKVVAGDIEVTTTSENLAQLDAIPNLRQVYVDNSNRLPFADNSFDLIFMRKGLCHCKCTTTSCGGIPRNFTARRDFLSEVMRVLDVRNSKSTAFLHGVVGMTEDDVREYQDAFTNIAESENFEFDVIRFPENGRFRAFRLRTKDTQH